VITLNSTRYIPPVGGCVGKDIEVAVAEFKALSRYFHVTEESYKNVSLDSWPAGRDLKVTTKGDGITEIYLTFRNYDVITYTFP
jgi:hypothetical protein